MNKEYRCICGQVFDNPQKFNGHKQGCKEHIINKYGSLESYYEIKNRNHENGVRKNRERYRLIRENDLQRWISEQHTCEKCGKIMTEKYGSGRFCSRSCAHSRTRSEESRTKTKISMQEIGQDLKAQSEMKYYQNPMFCSVCGNIIPYQLRYRKTCSKTCANLLISIKRTDYLNEHGVASRTVRRYYKYGTYKGFRCDSSWELAFVIYCLDHNLNIKRNITNRFLYYYQDQQHYFYPDFILDDCFYEIKAYRSDLTDAKLKYFPDNIPIKILYYEDIKQYLDYAIKTYGKNFTHLYDRNYPSWMDNQLDEMGIPSPAP